MRYGDIPSGRYNIALYIWRNKKISLERLAVLTGEKKSRLLHWVSPLIRQGYVKRDYVLDKNNGLIISVDYTWSHDKPPLRVWK